MKTNNSRAFTLIEVLISVIIISGSILFALQVHSQNREQILYISQKGQLSMQDSLFLGADTISYHKSKKNAYDVIGRYFKVDKLESRKILKEISRKYNIPEPLTLNNQEENKGMPSATVETINIKDKFSSSYLHFKINF